MRTFLMVIIITLGHCSMGMAGTICQGRFLNPITDIAWGCMFPLTIGNVPVSKGKNPDTANPKSPICTCSNPIPRVGLSIGFWEPVQIVDVTRTPLCFVSMGGLQLSAPAKGGQMGPSLNGSNKQSQYHLHWYDYPLLKLLEILVDGGCVENSDFDIAYLTEFDPTWQNETLSIVLNPEGILFGNIAAQAACSADALAATTHTGIDALFWCAGSQGSVYPFTSYTANHYGGVVASTSLVEKMTYKMHRELLLWGTVGQEGLCGKYPMPIWKKSQYRYQMAYPVASQCHPYGRSTVLWESGKEYPVKGEDFAYVVWRKRHCCAL